MKHNLMPEQIDLLAKLLLDEFDTADNLGAFQVAKLTEKLSVLDDLFHEKAMEMKSDLECTGVIDYDSDEWNTLHEWVGLGASWIRLTR